MDDSISVSIEFTGGNEIPVEFSNEGVTIPLELAPVGPRLFRVSSVPILAVEASFGDVIEVDFADDGGFRFVRVSEANGWRTYDFLFPRHIMESERITRLKRHVVSLGGHWECALGGVLFLCLPRTTDYDPTKDLEEGSERDVA